MLVQSAVCIYMIALCQLLPRSLWSPLFSFFGRGSPQLLGINLAVLSGTRKAMQCWGLNPGFCQARPALLPAEQFLISFKPNLLYLHFALCRVCLGDSNRSQGPTCLNKELKCLDISDFKGGP